MKACLLLLSVVLLLFVCIRKVQSSHFRGAIITWKPGQSQGEIIIEYLISWRTSYGSEVACNDNLIRTGTIVRGQGQLECFSNCVSSATNLGQLSFKCTDYNVNEDWSTGRGQLVKTLVSSQNPPSSIFQFGFMGGSWITLVKGGGNWVLRVTADIGPRPDTGKVNSSPTVTLPPVLRLQHGCNYTIRIPVGDSDNDIVKCRWAAASKHECGGICNAFPYATIDLMNCTISYKALYSLGTYAVAIQVEDFKDAYTSQPLSSVPVQFLVTVVQHTDACSAKPEFIHPTPQDGACITVPLIKIFQFAIVARVTSNNRSITEVKTVSPLGLTKSRLQHVNLTDWRIDVTFKPVPGGDISNMFCFYVEESYGLESEQRCVTFLSGVSPPNFIQRSPSGTVEINQRHWMLVADSNFTRSSSDAYIRLYNQYGHLLERIDASDSNEVILHTENRTIEFQTNTHLTEGEEYYFLVDAGIVKGTAYCGLESTPVEDPKFWRIRSAVPLLVEMKTSTLEANSITEELKWSVDEPVVITCNLTPPNRVAARISCYNTCIDTRFADGSYSIDVQATDMDGNQAVQTYYWSVDNCAGQENDCNTTKTVCLDFDGFSGALFNSSEPPPPQPPILEVEASNGFLNEPIELTVSARNLSGSLEDIDIYVNNFPNVTNFSRGMFVNASTLFIHNSDYGKMNMTTSYEGEFYLTVIAVQRFELVNVSTGAKLQIKVYPKLKDIEFFLNGCFAEDSSGSAVAVINSSIVFGNKLLDHPSRANLRVPYDVLLTVPSWVQPFDTTVNANEYEIGKDVINGMLKLNGRYEPINITVSVYIRPEGFPEQLFSDRVEIVQPCIGACGKNVFGPGCNQQCTCDWRNSVDCDSYNGRCACMPIWRGASCSDFACDCVYNNTAMCWPERHTCKCKDSWTGVGCDIDINECMNSSICAKFPNTDCQNREWGYDCLCLVGYELVNGSCTSIKSDENENTLLNTTTKEDVKSTEVTFQINFDVPETDNLKVAVTYNKYHRKAKIMLQNFYTEHLEGRFVRVIVHSISVGSLIIEHDVVTKNDVVTSQELAETIYRTIDGSETVRLVFGGIKVTVKEVLVEQRKVTDLCDAYYCENSECLIVHHKPVCRLDDDKTDGFDYIRLVIVAVSAITTVITIVCSWRKRRRIKECCRVKYYDVN